MKIISILCLLLAGCSATSITTPNGYRFTTVHLLTDRQIGAVRVVPTTQGTAVEVTGVNSKSNAALIEKMLEKI